MRIPILIVLSVWVGYAAFAQSKNVQLATAGKTIPVFVPNNGQWEGDFSLKTDIPGTSTSAFFSGNTWTFVQRPPIDHEHGPTKTLKETLIHLPKAHAWQMSFLGSKKTAKTHNVGEATHTATYLFGKRKATVYPTEEAQIENLYDGIEAQLFYQNERLRFDFILAPGANPNKIKIAYEGIQLSLQEGLLVLANPYGKIFQTVPRAFQLTGKDTLWIPVTYKLSGNVASFLVGRYDKKKPLVIDPNLIFSTFSGSRSDNWGSTATYGEDGSMFTGGAVFGSGFPVTLGAIDTSFNTTVDMGLLKYSPDGRRLLWATYLGGTKADNPISLVANPVGELYVLGITGSRDFPTSPRGTDTSFNGGPVADPMGYSFINYYFQNGADLSVSRLSSDGTQLLGSTFLGGSGTDGILKAIDSSALYRNYGDCFRGEIILDARQRPCIATHSQSSNFSSALSSVGRLGPDGQALALRLSANLDTLLNRFAFGGSEQETAFGIAQDSAGNTFLCGGTISSNFPATSNAYQTTYGGNADAFICRLNRNWSGIQAASYVGTPSYDQAYLLQVDNLGRPAIVGQTAGIYPRTSGVWSQGSAGGVFVHQLSADLNASVFSTAYGGPRPNLVITAFLIDVCNQMYIAGWGGSTNQAAPTFVGGSTNGLPITANASQATTDGSDFHVLVLDPGATALSYATFYGASDLAHGEHVDGGTSRFDKRSIVYQAVCGCGGPNASFPTTPGVAGPRNNSNNCNNAAFKFNFSPLKASLSTPQTAGCAPFTFQARNLSEYATSYSWSFDTLGVSTTVDSLVSFTFINPGQYTVRLRAFNTTNCFRKDSVDVRINVTGFGRLNQPLDTSFSICALGAPIPLQTRLPSIITSSRWMPSRYLNDSTLAAPTATPTANQLYQVTYRDATGCTATRQVRLIDRRLLMTSTLTDTVACQGFSRQYVVQAFPQGKYQWSLNGITLPDTNPSTVVAFPTPGRYVLRCRIQNDTTCPRFVEDSLRVTVNTFANGYTVRDTTHSYCVANSPIQLSTPLPAGRYTYTWFPNRFLSDTTIENPTTTTIGNQLYTTLITDSNGCSSTRKTRIIDRRLMASTNLSDTIACNMYTKRLVSNVMPGGRYKWFVNDTLSSSDPSYSFNISREGTHYLRFRVENDTTCSLFFEDSALVKINVPRPTELYQDTTLLVCPNDVFNLRAPEHSSGYTYTWLAETQAVTSLNYVDSIPTVTVVGPVSGKSMLLKLTQNRCENTRLYRFEPDTITPTYFVRQQYDTCQNLYSISITGTNTSADFYTLIHPIQGNQVVSPTNSFTYQVQGGRTAFTVDIEAKKRGCTASTTFQEPLFDISYNPIANFSINTRYPNCDGPALLAMINQSTSSLPPSYWLDGVAITGNQVRLPDSFDHKLTQIARIGPCADTLEVIVARKELNLANVITPNGDGKNDYFALPRDVEIPWKLQIHNKWGRPVAQWDDYSTSTFPQREDAGVYYYRLEGGGMQQACKGWVEVVR